MSVILAYIIAKYSLYVDEVRSALHLICYPSRAVLSRTPVNLPSQRTQNRNLQLHSDL